MKKIIENVARVSLVEAKQDAFPEQTGMIEVTVTTFGKRDSNDGRRFNYQPEGFMEWAKEVNSGSKSIPMFFQHNDGDLPVGVLNKVEMDDQKMNMSGQLYLNTQRGKDLYTILKQSPEMLNSVSIGAYAEEYRFVDDNDEETDDMGEGYFQITKGGASEVSIVMSPNNSSATINKLEMVREDGSLIEKNLEKALREEVGLSRSESVSAVRVIREFIAARDEQLTKLTETAVQGEPVATDLNLTEELDTQDLLNEIELYQLNRELNTRLKGNK